MNLDDPSELKRRLGFGVNLNSDADRKRLTEIINAKFWFRGQPIVGDEEEFQLLKLPAICWPTFRRKIDYCRIISVRLILGYRRSWIGISRVPGGGSPIANQCASVGASRYRPNVVSST